MNKLGHVCIQNKYWTQMGSTPVSYVGGLEFKL
jgi:hypothetical protein